MKENEYPWCSNSRRWIAVEFSLRLPKTCPNECEKECEWEKCAYFSWQEETPYLKKKRELMESYGLPIISSRKVYEDLEKEEDDVEISSPEAYVDTSKDPLEEK